MKGPIAAPFFAALASVGLVSAAIDLSSIPRKTTNPTVPGAFIVEIDPKSVGAAAQSGKRSANVPRFFPPARHLSLTLTVALASRQFL
jgi:hypothetical protein